MSKFRKKPVVIDATQWFQNGDHPDDACELLTAKDGSGFWSEGKIVRYFRHPLVDGMSDCQKCGEIMHIHGWIETLEGGSDGAQVVCPGDWIITGVQGERYPCKPDIFEATYEPVLSSPATPATINADESGVARNPSK